MAAEVKTTVTRLPESRVRVEAEVPAEEVERQVEQAARQLGRQLRVPGFRKGKVPAPVVIGRIGRETVLDEAIRSSLGGWYASAIDAAGIATVGDPALDVSSLPAEGEPLAFSIEIGVRPPAELGSYDGLEVGRREPEAAPERVDAELEQLRERLARLETAERPAQSGDFLVIDYDGRVRDAGEAGEGEPFEGGAGRDTLVELGSGRLIPGFEEQLIGATAGEERTVEIDFPGEDAPESLAGRHATFAVTVKEVKEKQLPELDDEFAAEAAGFDSLAELREDLERRLREADERLVEQQYREAVLDAVAAEATVELPESLVHARAHELWEQTLRALARQGISREAYLQMAGKDEEEIVHEAQPEAERALRREAVLAALIEAERIEPAEEDLVAALEHSAEHEGVSASELLERVRGAGRESELREDVATRMAIDRLVAAAKPISVEQAQARDKLWTPGRDEPEEGSAGGRIWTPGS
jgi:trigger factor